MEDERQAKFAWMNAIRVSIRTIASTVGALLLIYLIDLLASGLQANRKCNVPTGFFLLVALGMVALWMGAMLAQAAGAVMLSKMVTSGIVIGSLINSIILFIFFLMADHKVCSSTMTNGAAMMALVPASITFALFLCDVPPVLRKMFFKGDRSPLHQFSGRKKRSGPSGTMGGTFLPSQGPMATHSRESSGGNFAPAAAGFVPAPQPGTAGDFIPVPGTQPLSVNYSQEYQI